MKTLYDRLKDKEALEEVKKEYQIIGKNIELALINNEKPFNLNLGSAIVITTYLTNSPFDLETFENLFYDD